MKKISILLLAVFSLLFVAIQVPQAYSAPIVGNVDLNVEVFKGEGEAGKVTGHGLSQYAYGSRVSISLTGLKQTQEKEFGFYLYKGQLIEEEETEFLVTDSSKITIVLKDAGQAVAAFVDTNGALLDLKYGMSGFTPTAPTEVSDRPGFEFAGFGSVTSVTKHALFVAQYTRTKTDEITVSVTGGALVTGVTYNDVVTLEPTDLENFKYWADADGQFVSRKPDYTFTALENVTFVAVTTGVAPVLPSVYLNNVSGIRAGYQSFLGYVEFDETYELLEYGVLVSDEAKVLELGDVDVEKKPSTALSPINEFLRSFVEGTYSSFRAYAIFKQGTEQVVVYSDNNFVVNSSTLYETNAEGITIAYTDTLKVINGKSWNLNQVYAASNDINDKKNGSTSFRLRSNAGSNIVASMSTAFTMVGLTNIEFNYAWYGTHTEGRVNVAISINGTDWIDIDNDILPSATLQNYALVIDYSNLSLVNAGINLTTPVYVKIYVENTSGSGRSTNIDDIKFSTIIDSNMYSVTFIDENASQKYFALSGNTVVSATAAIKEGYSFAGWFNEYNELFDFNTPITRHTTLTAGYEINEYTLTFDTDSGTAVAPIVGDFGIPVIAPAAPTKDGYTFAGWSPALPETMPAGNQTYTATWEAIDYTITFDVDGGSAVAPLTQPYGSELVMPAAPTKDGYNFMGWFTDVERTLPFEATTMPLGNTTLYALWQDASLSSTVTFETNGGSDISPVVVNNGEVVLEPEDPTKEGYTFIGWYTDVALELAYDFEAFVSTDFTLYAKWEQNVYSISFDPNDGSTDSIQIKSAVHGLALIVAERPTQPTREGHNFVGWFDTNAASGGNQWVTGTIFTSVKTYYARWASSSTTATLDPQQTTSITVNINDNENINSYFNVANPGGAILNVTYNRNSASTHSIFNNGGGELRLYPGGTNGGQITISLVGNYKIISIKVNTSQNPTILSVNGAASVAGSPKVDFIDGVTTVTIKNTSSATSGSSNQLRITDLIIEYSPS